MAGLLGHAGILAGGVYGALRAGLVAEYLFATDASDTSGEGSDGTLQGSTSVSAGALTVPGALTDCVEVANDATLAFGTGSFSVVLWVKLDTKSQPANQVFVAKGRNTLGDTEYGLFFDQGNDRFVFYRYQPNLTAVRANTFGSPSTGVWYHVTSVYDSSAGEGHIFVNGILSDTLSGFAAGGSDTGFPLGIGNFTDDTVPSSVRRPMDGQIDDVRIYNRALSADEISTLYNLRPDLH